MRTTLHSFIDGHYRTNYKHVQNKNKNKKLSHYISESFSLTIYTKPTLQMYSISNSTYLINTIFPICHALQECLINHTLITTYQSTKPNHHHYQNETKQHFSLYYFRAGIIFFLNSYLSSPIALLNFLFFLDNYLSLSLSSRITSFARPFMYSLYQQKNHILILYSSLNNSRTSNHVYCTL